MATFLLRRDPARPEDRNSNAFDAALVTGVDETAARAAAAAAAPNGETRVPDTWLATQLTADDLPAVLAPVTWLVGTVVAPGEPRPGQ